MMRHAIARVRLASRGGAIPRRDEAGRVKRGAKAKAGARDEIAEQECGPGQAFVPVPTNCCSLMDGEAVFAHVPSAPGKPLNVGRALRVVIVMYRLRRGVQWRAGFCE